MLPNLHKVGWGKVGQVGRFSLPNHHPSLRGEGGGGADGRANFEVGQIQMESRMTEPENAGRDQAGRFVPGASGNPRGKPQGTRNRAIAALETLMGNSAEDVALAVIKAAEAGDTAAARLVLERVMPARKDSPIAIELPAVDGAAGLVEAGQAILAAVAAGEITPNEADALMSLIERQRRIVETADLEARLAALEGDAK
jgi:hypothetical protein